MKIKFYSLLLLSFMVLPVAAQNSHSVRRYYDAKIDSLVRTMRLSGAADALTADDDRENPAYYKMFVPPVLYRSTVERGMRRGFELPAHEQGTALEADGCREVIIDEMLLNLYRERPSMVTLTEEQLRSQVSARDMQSFEEAPTINFDTHQPVALPDVQPEQLETEYVKPNYWRTSGSFSLDFTQNYVSDNWHKGGENNKTLLAYLMFKIKYNDKKRLSFENTFEAKLGFTTVEADTLHSIKTNNDMLRNDTKLGYKIFKNVDLTANVTLQTQSMPSYPTNSNDFISNFMAPFSANFSVGLDYKRSGKNWDYSLYVAPLSSYNYKFVRYGHLASRNGIREGRQHKEDFGTKMVFKPNVQLMKNLRWSARMEFYSDYSYTCYDWENTFTMQLNKYFKATLFMHARFDDSSQNLYSEERGYWQLKEYMTLGLTYEW